MRTAPDARGLERGRKKEPTWSKTEPPSARTEAPAQRGRTAALGGGDLRNITTPDCARTEAPAQRGRFASIGIFLLSDVYSHHLDNTIDE